MGAKITGSKELRDDLQHASDDAVRGAKGVVSKGALNVKRDAKAVISGHAGRHGGVYIKAYPRSIGYDTTVAGTLVSSEIGPDKDKPQGPLGNLLEYGSVNNAAIPHLNPALDAEEPRFASALEDLGVDLLEGRAVRSDGPTDSG